MSESKGRRCDLCAQWHYRLPSDMGVCRREGGPVGGVGFAVPVAKAVLCKQDRAEFGGRALTATTADSWCQSWQCDGTPRATAVAEAFGDST